MMNNVSIRKIGIEDIQYLQKIGRDTFETTFSPKNSAEDMKQYLENQFSIEKLEAELTNTNSEFYFAELENKVIGYLKVNFGNAQTEIKDKDSIEIERIYVINEFHGKKIGQVLYDKAIDIAKQKAVSYIWLGVWQENPRAIRFYQKNGFVEFDKHIFKLGKDEQTDLLMRLDLIS